MIVLALSGYKRSGKDTVADHLISKDFIRVSFADPLKDMVAEHFGIRREWLDSSLKKEIALFQYPAPSADKFTETISNFMSGEFRTIQGFHADPKYLRSKDGVLQTFTTKWEDLCHTPRSLAILVGSSMRAGSTDFWVKKAIREIEKLHEKGYKKFVISDMRYKSECEQLVEAFGENLKTIRINRFDTSQSNDPSERDLDTYNFDFALENKGTKEELFDKLKSLLTELKAN